ncbi:hypothetical protein HL658_00665 [Azospirillum sp. RWY-5-1]|uniref:DUF937 domain-containing protein n=1 Tax=Azospirillum oleiclasticum TaxID=2735135 RepID=A0ABX2T1M0_9PROT|nr:hypothetical protein [Azospirillum oleiclasticum]NYZ11044.1 hypothetical protein [Azospirillum oleiclasticum]NYZ18206.1 hypothetical protein [Azospirillum oleiclasticum]
MKLPFPPIGADWSLPEPGALPTRNPLAVGNALAASPNAAGLAKLSSGSGSALADEIADLIAKGGPELTPDAIAALQKGSVGQLLGSIAGAGPAGGTGAAAYGPTSRFLGQALGRMAGPGAPNPVDVAARLLGRQPQVAELGMLANGAEGLLPQAARDALAPLV